MSAAALDARPRRAPFGVPIAVSIALHAVAIAAFLLLRPGPPPPSPPVYRVNLVAAPPGPRAVGVVRQQPAPLPAAPASTPVRPRTEPQAMPAPQKTPPSHAPARATPTPPAAAPPETQHPPPTAGGGETGGRGADVANVNTGGIDFPYPGYLENIVRQIAIRFKPGTRSALRAEVAFLIHRDGTVPVSSIRLVTRSGAYSFDLEAQGAVEAAANDRAFGPLPAGYPDDVLPVTFRFDPKLLR